MDMKIKLLCSPSTDETVRKILLTNNISISNNSSILVAEDGYDCDVDFGIKIIFKKEKLSDFEQVMAKLSNNENNSTIFLGMNNGNYKPINIEDISYFSAINNSTYINTIKGNQYIVKSKLYQLQEDLDHKFFRINKSELINMNKIKLITPMFKGKLILHLEGYSTPFDISRGYTKAFKERLGF